MPNFIKNKLEIYIYLSWDKSQCISYSIFIMNSSGVWKTVWILISFRSQLIWNYTVFRSGFILFFKRVYTCLLFKDSQSLPINCSLGQVPSYPWVHLPFAIFTVLICMFVHACHCTYFAIISSTILSQYRLSCIATPFLAYCNVAPQLER